MKNRFFTPVRALSLALTACIAGTCLAPVAMAAKPIAVQSVQHDLTGAPAARAAAVRGLADFKISLQSGLAGKRTSLSRIPLSISSAADLNRLQVGYGFETYTVTPDRLLKAGLTTSLDRLVTPTGIWNFTIQLKGSAVGLITVEQIDGRWTMSTFGSAGLAQQVDNVSRKYGIPNSQFHFVRIYQANTDLLQVASSGASAKAGGGSAAPRYIPLDAGIETLSQYNSKFADGMRTATIADMPTGSQLIPSLQAAVKSNLDGFNR